MKRDYMGYTGSEYGGESDFARYVSFWLLGIASLVAIYVVKCP